MSDDRTARLHAVERWTLGLGAVLTIVGFAMGREAGLSVSIGAALMGLNAFAIRRVAEKLWSAVRAEGSVSPARAVILFNVKLLALLAVIYLVVTRLHVNPIAFLIGLSTYPLAAVAVALTYVAPAGVADPVEDPHG